MDVRDLKLGSSSIDVAIDKVDNHFRINLIVLGHHGCAAMFVRKRMVTFRRN